MEQGSSGTTTILSVGASDAPVVVVEQQVPVFNEKEYSEEEFRKLSTKQKVALIVSQEDANRDRRMALAIMERQLLLKQGLLVQKRHEEADDELRQLEQDRSRRRERAQRRRSYSSSSSSSSRSSSYSVSRSPRRSTTPPSRKQRRSPSRSPSPHKKQCVRSSTTSPKRQSSPVCKINVASLATYDMDGGTTKKDVVRTDSSETTVITDYMDDDVPVYSSESERSPSPAKKNEHHTTTPSKTAHRKSPSRSQSPGARPLMIDLRKGHPPLMPPPQRSRSRSPRKSSSRRIAQDQEDRRREQRHREREAEEERRRRERLNEVEYLRRDQERYRDEARWRQQYRPSDVWTPPTTKDTRGNGQYRR